MEYFDKHPWVIGFLGVIIGVVLKALIDTRFLPRKCLGYMFVGRSIIRPVSQEELNITYHGEQIERLDSYRVLFRNKGNVSLEDIPITIKCSGAIRGKVSYKGPDGEAEWNTADNVASQALSIQQFALEESDSNLVFNRSLLNRGETFFIEFLVSNGDGRPPRIQVRSPDLDVTGLFGLREQLAILLFLPALGTYMDTFSIGDRYLIKRRWPRLAHRLNLLQDREDSASK